MQKEQQYHVGKLKTPRWKKLQHQATIVEGSDGKNNMANAIRTLT
jgi:hypothetical protein